MVACRAHNPKVAGSSPAPATKSISTMNINQHRSNLKNLDQDKAIVLLSGGQDSATCLAVALSKHPNVIGLVIDYGQRHNIEIDCAGKLAKKAGIKLHHINNQFLNSLNPNALTSDDIGIEHNDGELPSTFVPGRNALFLTVASMLAYQYNAKHIYTGVCQTDYSGYPDCRDAFINSQEKTINLAMETDLSIHTPLMHLTKADTVRLMQRLGHLDWYALTHTCYEGKRPACGQCPACKLRLNGFKEANINDPLAYEPLT